MKFGFFGQIKVIKGKNNYSWILKRHLAQLIRENNTSIHFRSLTKGFESIIDVKFGELNSF